MQAALHNEPAPHARIPRDRWAAVAAAARDRAECNAAEQMAVVMPDGVAVWLPNLATVDAERAHQADPNGFRRYARDMVALVHTHPHGCPIPSVVDQRQQVAMGVPWCVFPRGSDAFWFGDGTRPDALRGRPYRFGVTDCFDLARDWYAAQGVHVPAVPREWRFWDHQDLFGQAMRRCGFEVVPGGDKDLVPGDGLVLWLRSQHPNHCAVYLGNGEMLHHPASGDVPSDPTWLSRRDPVERWIRFPHQVLRHA